VPNEQFTADTGRLHRNGEARTYGKDVWKKHIDRGVRYSWMKMERQMQVSGLWPILH